MLKMLTILISYILNYLNRELHFDYYSVWFQFLKSKPVTLLQDKRIRVTSNNSTKGINTQYNIKHVLK